MDLPMDPLMRLPTLAQVAAAIVLFTALVANPARADGPRVAVLPFDGGEAIGTRVAMHEALADAGVDLASLSEAASAARRARVRGMSRRRIERVLELADVDAAVQGHTTVSGDRVTVRLVLSGSDGSVLLDLDAELDELDDVAAEMQQALGRPARGLASRTARVEREEPEAPPSVRRAERASRRGERTTPSAPVELPWLVAGIGGSARMRDGSFDADDGTRYHRAWYPSIDLGAELRPFHTASGVERGLFFRASFYHSVGLRSRGPNDTIVDTAFWGLGADGGLLINVSDGWDVGFALGVGIDSFGLADSPATLVPTAVYGTLRPGLRARAQLLDELVVLDIGAGYRWVFERGPIAAAFGRSGESHGFEAGATLGGSVDVGFSWAVSADVVTVVHQMHGDADVISASGGRDIGVRFGARIGLALR